MENLGEFLRQQRENKNISLEEMATRTRIAIRFIRLIEENQFDQLPNVVSAKGFLRSYARCIGLEEAPILNRFSETIQPAEVSPVNGKQEPVPAYIQRKQPDRLPFPLWAAFSVVGVIILFVVLAFVIPKQRQAPPPPPEEEAPVSESLASESSSPIPLPPEAGAVPTPPPPVPSQPVQPAPAPTPAPAPSAVPSPAAPPQGAAVAPRVLMIEAMEQSWVHVTIDGAETKEALLQPTQKVKWVAKEKFVLTVGNAGGVRVLLDGEDLGPLGPVGRVIKKEIVAKR